MCSVPRKNFLRHLQVCSCSHCCRWMGGCTKICQNKPHELKIFENYLYLVLECQLNLFKPMELAVQTPVCSWVKKTLTSKSEEVGACCWNDEMIKGYSVPRIIVPTATYASESAGNQLRPDNSFCPEKNVPVRLFKFTFWPTSFVHVNCTFVANPKKKQNPSAKGHHLQSA